MRTRNSARGYFYYTNPQRMNSQTILIIDDESEIVSLLTRVLIRQGYQVCAAHNLKDGFDSLGVVKPDILFLDMNLPDGNGLEQLSKIKEHYPDLKIIMISAFDVEEHRKKARDDGAYSFLSKPFTLSQVSDLIDGIKKN